jgi:hypothetical protein
MKLLSRLILVSGFWNLILSLYIFANGIAALEHDIQDAYFDFFMSLFLSFTSAALIISSRDLARRASIVFWEGYLRFAAGILLVTLGMKIIGNIAIALSMIDILWGIIYQVGLCRALKKSYSDLLLDR